MKQRIITIGEIMLRLTPPGYEGIRDARWFRADYGGSEANVALSLAGFGADTAFFTVVPDNSLGKGAVGMLRSHDVDCSKVKFISQKEDTTARLGVYYMEEGYGIRPGRVIYDRRHSAFAEYDFGGVDWEEILSGYTWLHVSGITAALGKNCRSMLLSCLKNAKEREMTVSFDGNYRGALWGWEEARDFCTMCLPYVDVLFGIEPFHLWRDEKDHGKGDLKDALSSEPGPEAQEEVFRLFAERYPDLKYIIRHIRKVHNSSKNSLMAYLWHEGRTYQGRRLTFDVLDRVGSGDAFVSGIIYGILQKYPPQDILDFGTGAGALKHTVPGDVNPMGDVFTVKSVMREKIDIER